MSNVALEPLLKVKDAAAYLRVDPVTVYRLLSQGKLPARKVGQSWRFRRDELEAYASGVIMSDASETREADHAKDSAA